MISFLLRYTLLTALTSLMLSTAFAQQSAVEQFQARVVTKDGNRFRGIIDEVTDTYLYIDYRSEQIPLAAIRKVVIHRKNKKTGLVAGAVAGALLVGFLANESLQRNQTRSAISYGLTLTFAAAGGATAGLIVSSAIGKISRGRVIRPRPPGDPELSLQRQLTPFSISYQQDLLNRLPDKNK